MEINFKLDNHNVLLAGATNGVGLELAKLLVSCEANVIIIGRDENKGKKALKELECEDEKKNFLKGDLYSKSFRKNLIGKIKDIFPSGIQHFVSFIGTGKTQFGMEIGLENWKDSFEKNFFSVIDLVEILLPIIRLKNKNNSIIITSAIAGLERLSAPQSYSCAKSALSAYVPHLAKFLAHENIRVNGICPGNIFFKGGRWEEIVNEKGVENIKLDVLSKVSLNKFAKPEELAWMYLSVMSPRNSFMTGVNLIVDGQQVNKIF